MKNQSPWCALTTACVHQHRLTAKVLGTELFAALGLNAQNYKAGLKTIDNDDTRLAQLSVILPQVAHEPVVEVEPAPAPTQRKMHDFFKKVTALSM